MQVIKINKKILKKAPIVNLRKKRKRKIKKKLNIILKMIRLI